MMKLQFAEADFQKGGCGSQLDVILKGKKIPPPFFLTEEALCGI